MRAFIILAALLSSAVWAQEGEIGRWYDEAGGWFSATIIIEQTSSVPVSHTMTTKYDGGDTTQNILGQTYKGDRRVFRPSDSPHGEYFWINDDGDLEIYDDDGYIRTARAIE